MRTKLALAAAAVFVHSAVAIAAFTPIMAQEAQDEGVAKISVKNGFPASLPDQQIGHSFVVRPDDLPPNGTGAVEVPLLPTIDTGAGGRWDPTSMLVHQCVGSPASGSL